MVQGPFKPSLAEVPTYFIEGVELVAREQGEQSSRQYELRRHAYVRLLLRALLLVF